ncbi:hypothetical protein V1514DRAFT_338387, partial [Lipomyces japonicus]|uniref:uncharacterized protein n=1 Tax=Lipomyces japonicus TaxID=56871 RepID=UPI0034CFD4C1
MLTILSYTTFKDHISLADYEIHNGTNIELYVFLSYVLFIPCLTRSHADIMPKFQLPSRLGILNFGNLLIRFELFPKWIMERFKAPYTCCNLFYFILFYF